MDKDSTYKIDKTVFTAMKVDEANAHHNDWKNKSLKERLDAGCYLTNQMYGTTPQTPIDKTVFTKRKHRL